MKILTTSPIGTLPYSIALSHLGLELVSSSFLPIIYPLLIDQMGLTYTQIGTLALVATLFGALTQPLFGWWSDRWDARLIVPISIAWSGLFLGAIGFLQNYVALTLFIGLGMLGSAAFHPAGASLVSLLPRRTIGRSMSLFSVGGNIGSALSPLVVGAAVLWLGLAGTAVLLPVSLVVAGVLAFEFLDKLPAPKTAAPESREAARPTKHGSWLALGLIVIIVAARSWVQGGLMTYLPEWLQSQGVSAEWSNGLLSLLMVSVAVGSLSGGTLSDRIGRVQIVLLTSIIMIPAIWLFLNTAGALQVGGLVVIGIMTGGTFPVVILMAQDAWPEAVGVASALVIGIGWLPSGIGAWVIGRVADASTLTSALATLSLVPAVAIAAVLLYRRLVEEK